MIRDLKWEQKSKSESGFLNYFIAKTPFHSYCIYQLVCDKLWFWTDEKLSYSCNSFEDGQTKANEAWIKRIQKVLKS